MADEMNPDTPPPMRTRSVSAEGESLYTMLDVAQDATQSDISKAYRKLALKHHPDKNPDNVDFANTKIKELNDAYAVLKDPTKRKIYDHWGSYGLEAAKKFGDDFVLSTIKMDNWCMKALVGFCCIITGCCCCCCLCCCCGQCCQGKAGEGDGEGADIPMEVFQEGDGQNGSTPDDHVVTSEPV